MTQSCSLKQKKQRKKQNSVLFKVNSLYSFRLLCENLLSNKRKKVEGGQISRWKDSKGDLLNVSPYSQLCYLFTVKFWSLPSRSIPNFYVTVPYQSGSKVSLLRYMLPGRLLFLLFLFFQVLWEELTSIPTNLCLSLVEMITKSRFLF